MKRGGFLKRNVKPIARKPWRPTPTPIPKVNREATAKRKKRQSKDRNGDETKEAKRVAWEKANGFCEECGGTFDMDDQFSPAAPEAHHDHYGSAHKPPKIRYLHRRCHHLLEMTQYGYRQHGKRSA